MQNHLLLKALTFVALGTFGINSSFADTITLKSGKVLEGKVLEDLGEEYLLEVQVTRSIKDRKKIKKSDVVSIEKTAEDAQPFEDLKGTLPTGDQMAAGDYRLLIEGKLKPFIEKFPKSEHLPEVKKMLSTLEGELKRVEAGDVKLEGKWIAASEWNSNAFDLDSLVLFNKMEMAAKGSSYRQALLIYDNLKDSYPASEGLVKARALASKILPAYQRIISGKVSSVKQRIAERERSIQGLPVRDRPRVEASHTAEKERYAAILAKAKEEKVRWIPAYDYDERSLTSIARVIKSEITALSRVRDSRDNLAELYRETWAAAGKGEASLVQRNLSKFRSKKVDPKYAQLLSAHLAANPAPEPVEEEQKPEPKPEPEEPKVEEKPKPKKKPQPSDDLDLSDPEEEEGGGMMTVVYVILALALIGILVGVLLKSRKSDEEE